MGNVIHVNFGKENVKPLLTGEALVQETALAIIGLAKAKSVKRMDDTEAARKSETSAKIHLSRLINGMGPKEQEAAYREAQKLSDAELASDDSQVRIKAAIDARLAVEEMDVLLPGVLTADERAFFEALIDHETTAWGALNALEKAAARREMAALERTDEPPQAG